MKEKIKIRNIRNIASVIGLVMVLALSPCEVRNFIHSELGIPQIKVGNKSQTTITASNCNTPEISENTLINQKPDFKFPSLKTPDLNFDFSINGSEGKIIYADKTRNNSFYLTPLYILYHNFKIHL